MAPSGLPCTMPTWTRGDTPLGALGFGETKVRDLEANTVPKGFMHALGSLCAGKKKRGEKE